jgi:hypothetical protein
MKEVTLKSVYGDTYEGYVRTGKYSNGRRAIEIMSKTEGPIAKISVNVIDMLCPKDYAWIKNYSENEGFMEQLIKQGVLSEPIQKAISGHVIVFLCKVLSN